MARWTPGRTATETGLSGPVEAGAQENALGFDRIDLAVTPGAQVAARQTAVGYNLEIAIPWTDLALQPAANLVMGANIAGFVKVADAMIDRLEAELDRRKGTR